MTAMKEKTHTTLPSFPSMVSCSAACKIPLALIRAAKRAGAPGFDQAGRVHLALLLPWFFASGDALTGTDWHQRLKRAQALRAELETAKRRGELVDAATLGAQLAKGGHAMRSALTDAETFAAPKLAVAGDDIPRNREVLREVLWSAFVGVRDAMAPFLDVVDAHTRAEAEKISNPPENEKHDDTKTPAHDAGREGAPTARRKRSRGGQTRTGTRDAKDDRPSLGGEVRTAE